MKIEHTRFVTPFQGYSALKGRNIIAQGKTLGKKHSNKQALTRAKYTAVKTNG